VGYHGYIFWFMQPCPKNLRTLRLCAGYDKKETGCTRVSAADTLDLHQVGNGVHGWRVCPSWVNGAE